MQIPSQNPQAPADPVTTRRSTQTGYTAPPAPGATGTSSSNDQVSLGSSGGSDVGRYVQILKSMNPLDTNKVDSLRSRIREGSYTATVSDLAEPMTAVLGAGSNGSGGNSGQNPG